jgi:hypothetical protein
MWMYVVGIYCTIIEKGITKDSDTSSSQRSITMILEMIFVFPSFRTPCSMTLGLLYNEKLT